MLTKLSIHDYRGFYQTQTLEFAQPDGKDGSGLTLIVGPNNTGKTTIIESLLMKDNSDKRFTTGDRHEKKPPEISITTKKGESKFTNIDGGSQITLAKNSKTHELKFDLIPSRRYWQAYSGSEMPISSLVQQSVNLQTRGTNNQLDLAAALKTINRIPAQKTSFNGYLKQVIPHFTEWTIDTDNQNDYVKYKTATAEHHANLSGDGIISVFRLCSHFVAEEKNAILIIDEPELSLHPEAQKALSRVISQAAKDRQIILCTHSPHFANWDDLINGAKFVRLNKPNDQQCEISYLDNQKKYSDFIKNNYMEWQKPQLLDYVAKEILFADRILLTEGQQDVGLIRKWLKENNKQENINIFGYGVGSYSNMKLFLELAKDLGLSKVAALYDNGTESSAAHAQDQSDYQNYKLEILPTNDIRDKHDPNDDSKILVDGCFDKSGDLKPSHADQFNQIMDRIIHYLSK
jgi:predicted ATP-dependent endonuclease of OLD family